MMMRGCVCAGYHGDDSSSCEGDHIHTCCIVVGNHGYQVVVGNHGYQVVLGNHGYQEDTHYV